MKTYVLFHHPCPDGTGAAMAAWLALGDDAEYIGVNYGNPPPEIPDGSHVRIIDFSYPRDVLESLAKRMASILVLDHHATAEKDLAGLPYAMFDMGKSGAILAWEHFHPNDPYEVPRFIQYLDDRDRWVFAMDNSREISMALRSYPFDFRLWAELAALHRHHGPVIEAEDAALTKLRHEGIACRRLTEQQVDTMARNHRWGYFDPKKKTIRFTEKHEPGGDGEPTVPAHIVIMPVANATVFFSEVGEKLLEMYPAMDCAGYYFDRASGQRQWGLRSRQSFDCSELAKAFGGGGHKQAAGMVL